MGMVVPFLVIVVVYAVPIAAAVWLFRTLRDMRDTQRRIAEELTAIRQRLDGRP
jgi:hypothetical protein